MLCISDGWWQWQCYMWWCDSDIVTHESVTATVLYVRVALLHVTVLHVTVWHWHCYACQCDSDRCCCRCLTCWTTSRSCESSRMQSSRSRLSVSKRKKFAALRTCFGWSSTETMSGLPASHPPTCTRHDLMLSSKSFSEKGEFGCYAVICRVWKACFHM